MLFVVPKLESRKIVSQPRKWNVSIWVIFFAKSFFLSLLVTIIRNERVPFAIVNAVRFNT